MNISLQNPQQYSPCSFKGHKKVNQLSTTCFDISKDKKNAFIRQLVNKTLNKCNHSHSQPNKNLVFKPVIHEMPFSLHCGQSRGKINKSKEEIRQKLFEDSTKTTRQRWKAKIKKQEQQFGKYTFHPQISSFSQHLATTQLEGESIHERLFKQAEIKQQERIQAQRKKQQRQIQQINQLLKYKLELKNKRKYLNTQKHNLNPIESRIQQILKQKIKQKKQLEQKILKEQQVSFHPEVNSNSYEIAKKREERENLKGNVVKRLMQQYQKIKKNKEDLSNKVKELQSKSCTFKPQINQNFVIDKQIYDEQDTQSTHRQHIHREYTFIPKINQLSNLIVMHVRGQQDQQTRLNRITTRVLEERQINIENTARQMYSEVTFKPKINEISNLVGIRAAPRLHCCEGPEEEIFPYHPKINEKSKLMRAQSLELGKLRMKKRQLQYKLSSEYHQMKQCSFRPKVNNKRHLGQRTITEVQGATQYINFQQKSRAKTTQLKNRQRQLFHLEHRYDQRRNKSSRL